MTTDHFPIILEIPTACKKDNTQTIHYRRIKDVDPVKFQQDLLEALKVMENSKDANFLHQYMQYDEITRRVVEEHSPLLSRKVNPCEPGWIDQEYRKNRALRRKLERLWKKNRNEESMKNYVDQKEKCTEMALIKQREHYSKLLDGKSGCQKSLFKVANELLDKNSKKVLPAHDDSKKLANDFNKFYVDKVNKIRKSIPPVSDTPAYYSRPFKGEMMMELCPTSVEELREIIKKSGVKTSMEDPIPAKLFKAAVDTLLPVIAQLINQSLKEGSLDGVKWSVIDPLLKKFGLDSDVWKNYRPVNNLVFFSKLIERVAGHRLDEHMHRNNLHEASAYAYKQYHNTETMMVGITDEVLRGFDQNKATIVIFLDLSAAFDTIDIEKVLQIMHDEIGVGGTALEWFRSFLSGRTQKVKINGEYSESLEVPCGAPQGSVLGPKIFNINVRSQPLVFTFCLFTTSSFADDSNGRKQFALTFQFQILKNDVPNCMNHIVNWSNAHFMKINPDKTELLLLRPASLNSEVLINGVFFGDQCIRFSPKVKNVGVILDQNLTMDQHVNGLVSHCYKTLKDIGRIKKYLQKHQLEQLVHSVTSRLDSCNSILVNCGSHNIYKLQKVQNTAARLILSKRRRDSATAALRELHWLNIESRITFKILLLVHKVVRRKCPENLTLNYKTFNGRSDDLLKLEEPVFKTKYGKRLFVYNGPRLWNALPTELRMEEDTEKYKKGLKTLLFDGHEDLKRNAFKYNT